MSDFSVLAQDTSLVTISTASMESLGPWIRTLDVAAVLNTTAWPAANQAIYIPFTVATPFLAARMFIYNGGTVNSNVDLGIYDDQGNTVVTKGTTVQATINVLQFLDITDTTLNPGVYYMACAMDNTTATPQSLIPTSTLVTRTSGILSQSTAFPLPTSTATFAAAQAAYIPMIGITSRTV